MQDLLLGILPKLEVNQLTSYVRLLSKTTRLEQCLIAPANHSFGYSAAGKTSGHRLAWIVNNGPIPKGMFVCHTCDNPQCVEIKHLFLGTAKDNCQDKAAKGRLLRGEKHPATKITEEQVRIIKSSSDKTVKQLARELNVASYTVRDVRAGLVWKHIKV